MSGSGTKENKLSGPTPTLADNSTAVAEEHRDGFGSQPVETCAKASGRACDGPDADDSELCDPLGSARKMMMPASAICLVLLTFLAISYSMYFCKPVMLPIIGAFLLNFLFSPVVAKLNRLGLPNAAGALLVLIGTIASVYLVIMFAYDPAREWLANRDENIANVERKLMSLKKPFEEIQNVSEQIDKLTQPKSVDNADEKTETSSKPSADVNSMPAAAPTHSPDPGISAPTKSASISDPAREFPVDFASNDSIPTLASGLRSPRTIPIDGDDVERLFSREAVNDELLKTPDEDNSPASKPVPVELRQPSISSRIFSTTGDVLIGVSLMFVLLFYLLASGDRGLGKLIEIMPHWRQKRRTVELARAIEKSISSYLVTTTFINFGLGLLIGTGLWLMGVPNPILWGVMAMLLNYFPFIGAAIGACIVFVVAVTTFDSIAFAAIAPLIYLGANLVEANFITPVLISRSVSLHPVWLMIFFVVVSWVWGLGGAIVAVPVLAVIKITCDHIEPLTPLGAFLGR